MRRALPASLSLLALAGCHRSGGNPAPPRVTAPARLPSESSTVVVPVDAPLADLQRAIEAQAPRALWKIDRHEDKCVAAKKVNLGIAKVKLVPQLGCDIVGQVTRGPVTLGGHGDTLDITMPVHAEIAAEHVGGLASKTATGDAVVHAVARLSIVGDWQPRAKVTLSYDWTTPPGIDFLGKRIEFTDKADEKLKPVVAKLERETIPHELAKLNLRAKLADTWRQGFTSLQLNRDNPPAWMRVTPQHLGVGGYSVQGRNLRLTLAAQALTETFVGDRPPDPKPTPLPPPSPVAPERGLVFYIPVVADYAQLEPVVQRTLRKLAAKGITLRGIGPVDAQFGDVTVYATTGGRMAIGVATKAKAKEHGWLSTAGTIWLTAQPYNQVGSQVVRARDIRIATDTDHHLADLLVALFDDAGVQASIRDSLTYDFGHDYAKVLTKAQNAIAAKRTGDFVLSVSVDGVENGRIAATGAGLFMPMRVTGHATITYRPK